MDYYARVAVLESHFKNHFKSHYPSKTGLHSLIIYLSLSLRTPGSVLSFEKRAACPQPQMLGIFEMPAPQPKKRG
jgi:hypothetical protein